MKKIITTLCALCIVAFSFAQSSEDQKTNEGSLIKVEKVETQIVDAEFIRFFEGTVYINGEIKGTKDIIALRQEQIASMKVFKGAVARERFNITHNQGVIEVVTK